MPSSPAPIVVPASQTFDGNDGPWSSFNLQVGTPAQDVSIFISTAGYQTWAVVPAGCTSSDPSNCESSRGGFFQPNKSTTWKPNNVTSNSIFVLDLEENLGYSGNGEYGYDTVALGWQGSGGPTLDQQIVGGIATKDFYLGTFGLTPRPTNFTNFTHPVPSYMENLKAQTLIPSLSWSYSAGNQYRLSKALGSLTLGGYDTSKFIPNNVSFPFNSIDIRDLTVNLNSIDMVSKTGERRILSNSSLPMFIDSTMPFIYLPVDVCLQFESAFGLTWNDTVQAYLVNDTQHAKLEAQNANVTFTLGNGQPDTNVNITLPYAAFDLNASYPLINTPSRYFPLTRATNETQYTLGRTFFQEAYVIADYERRNFSVSQCSWDPNAQQNIEAITSPSNNSNNTTTGLVAPSPNHQLPAGEIAGIVVGCAAMTFLITLLIYFFQKLKKNSVSTSDYDGKPELETNPPERPPYIHNLHEADSEQHLGTELEGKRLPGHEVEGDGRGHEVEGDVHRLIAEMTGDKPGRPELDNRQYPSQELPGNDVRHEIMARRDPRYELPASEVSRTSFATSTERSSR